MTGSVESEKKRSGWMHDNWHISPFTLSHLMTVKTSGGEKGIAWVALNVHISCYGSFHMMTVNTHRKT
jgi:hypothetical protein